MRICGILSEMLRKKWNLPYFSPGLNTEDFATATANLPEISLEICLVILEILLEILEICLKLVQIRTEILVFVLILPCPR